jgi:hypothetical protein
MRSYDKNTNMDKVNLLVERRFLESKGIIKEEDLNITGQSKNIIRGHYRGYKFLIKKDKEGLFTIVVNNYKLFYFEDNIFKARRVVKNVIDWDLEDGVEVGSERGEKIVKP